MVPRTGSSYFSKGCSRGANWHRWPPSSLCRCFALASSSQKKKKNQAQCFSPLTKEALLPTVAQVQEYLDRGPSSHAVSKTGFFLGCKRQRLVTVWQRFYSWEMHSLLVWKMPSGFPRAIAHINTNRKHELVGALPLSVTLFCSGKRVTWSLPQSEPAFALSQVNK